MFSPMFFIQRNIKFTLASVLFFFSVLLNIYFYASISSPSLFPPLFMWSSKPTVGFLELNFCEVLLPFLCVAPPVQIVLCFHTSVRKSRERHERAKERWLTKNPIHHLFFLDVYILTERVKNSDDKSSDLYVVHCGGGASYTARHLWRCPPHPVSAEGPPAPRLH